MPTQRTSFYLLDDNPATLDLLGFDAVVAPVVEAIRRSETHPLTVGIRGGWGTGKSTLLGLIEQSLSNERRVLVIRLDPWEFESADHLRTTLIELVLTQLQERLPKNKGLSEKIRRLIGRIRFDKVATSLLKGLATVSLDGGLGVWAQLAKGLASDVDSFVAAPDEGDAVPPNMYRFRIDFAALIADVHSATQIEKVVVLVDDLDRCLPNAVVETLEAIKLFLSVDRMVFVLAADEGMVRSAIAVSLAGTGRASAFANMYLEKIVQLPLTIPSLTPDDAVTFATLLLVGTADQDVYGSPPQ